MSSANRSTSRGGKGSKSETSKSSKTDTKTDQPKAMDHNPKVQEQILMAKMIETKSEDPDIKDKIKQLMDATRKTEDEVTTALHDCDNDLVRAVNMILEGSTQGEWETTEKKKKKNRQASSTKADAAGNRENSSGGGGVGNTEEEWETSNSNNREPANTERDRPRQRGGGPPRLRARGGGNQDNRGWRGRENKENEKNLEDGISGGGGGGGGYNRRGGRSMNGPARSGRGGRGGSRLGPRTFQSRSGGGDSGGRGSGGGTFSRPIETWTCAEQEHNEALKMEDWDNEEYTGSLADTKVFTPSTHVVEHSVSTTVGVGTDGNVQQDDLESTTQKSHTTNVPVPPPTQTHVQQAWYQNSGSGPTPLNAAQTEYLTQLTQQSSENYKSANSATVAAVQSTAVAGSTNNQIQSAPSNIPVTQTNAPSLVQSGVQTGGASSATGYSTPFQTTTPSSAYVSSGYSASSYSVTSTYGTHGHVLGDGSGNVVDHSSAPSAVQMPPQRVKTLRPRVPPPSKIPSSAVEMPGDAINSSIAYLDVQFGALEFGSDSGPFDGVDPVLNSATASQNQQTQQQSVTSSTVQQQPTQVQPSQQQQQVQAAQVSGTSAVAATGSSKYPGLDQMPSPRPSVPPVSAADVAGLDAFAAVAAAAAANSNVQKAQNTLTTALGAQKITDSMLASEAHKQSQPPTSVGSATVYGSSSRDLDKTDASTGLANAYSTQTATGPYQAYQSAQTKTPAATYQQASSYNTNYSSNQVTSTTAYPSYSSTASNAATVATGAYPSAGSNNNSGYGQTAAYGSSGSSSQAFPQPNQNTTYPTAATVAGAGSVNTAGAGAYAAASQVPYQNSYASTTAPNHVKLSAALNTVAKDNQFDTTTSTSNLGNNTIATSATSGVSGAGSGTVAGSAAAGNTGAGSGSGNSGTGAGASSSQTVNTTSTKVTSSTGSRRSSTSSSAWPYGASTTTDHVTLSAGVPPILGTHQYIMSQGGMPYFQQPMFSYEDLQIIQQQRLPHMTSGHYDVGLPFQAPTSLATGREAGLANVAYSMSDGRFTRADSNASPVPSTLSQQNATQHQQPLINPTAALPPGYAYFYGAGMVPTGGFQYGTPAIYPQMPPATNSTSNSQYGKPGTGYGSGYGSGYDGLAQSQDYSKPASGYAVSGTGSVSKSTAAGVAANAAAAAVAAAAGSTSSDPLSATMLYGKQHAALVSKVNSYEKQGFHSATPPPFNLAGSQTAMAAPSGAFTPHVFIPTMAAPHQQHHSTTLTTLMHQPPLQESGTSSSQRSQASTQPNKSAAKQGYATSYWTAN